MPSGSNQSETAPYNTPDHGSELPTLPVPPPQLSGLNSSLSSGTLASLVASSELAQANEFNRSHESLRLLLSCYLAELHGGHISIQGTPESGYRYVVSLLKAEGGKSLVAFWILDFRFWINCESKSKISRALVLNFSMNSVWQRFTLSYMPLSEWQSSATCTELLWGVLRSWRQSSYMQWARTGSSICQPSFWPFVSNDW